MTPLNDITNPSDNISAPVDAVSVFGPQRDSLYIVLPITIIYTLIFITGVLGNIFTCIVIVRNKIMHTATNYYLFSLAMSDLLLLVSGMPQEIYTIWSRWPYVFGYTFCVLRGLAAETSTNASVLTITLFTIERYLAICQPFVSHQMSKLSRAMKHVIVLWMVALASALPQALQFGLRSYKGVTMCLQTRVIIEHSFEISTFVFFFTPMVLISVLYLLIGLKLREANITREESLKEFESSNKHCHKVRRKYGQSTRRVIKMLVAVVIAFFICWAPFHAQRLVAIYGTTEDHLAKSPILFSVYSFLTYISGIFYYMSTCINPILYHIMSNKFRNAFKNTTIKWCNRSQEGAAVKRSSYTAIVTFVRNPTTSTKSGKSQENNASFYNKIRKQGSVKGDSDMNVCQNKRRANMSPRKKQQESTSGNIALDGREINKIETIDERNTNMSIYCTYPSPVTATQEAVILCGYSDKSDSSQDHPENYLKEDKLKLQHRQKENG